MICRFWGEVIYCSIYMSIAYVIFRPNAQSKGNNYWWCIMVEQNISSCEDVGWWEYGMCAKQSISKLTPTKLESVLNCSTQAYCAHNQIDCIVPLLLKSVLFNASPPIVILCYLITRQSLTISDSYEMVSSPHVDMGLVLDHNILSKFFVYQIM